MKLSQTVDEIATLEDLIFIVIAIILAFLVPFVFTSSPYLGCILTSGSYIVDNFSLYLPNLYLYTGLNEHWVNSSWLSDVIFTLLYRAGSYSLLVIFSALLMAALFTFIFRMMMLKYQNWLINVILLIMGIIASSYYFDISSRLISYIILFTYVILLDRLHQEGFNKKLVFSMLFLTVFWANVSTDFLFGLVIILIYALSALVKYLFEKEKSLLQHSKWFLLLCAGCLLVSFLNPAGWNLVAMVYHYFAGGLHHYNGFLSSPDFHIKYPFRYFELFILGLVFLAGFSKYRPDLNKLLTILFLFFISLYSAINIVFFILVSLPFLSEVIKKTIQDSNFTLIQKMEHYTYWQKKEFRIFFGSAVAVMMILIGVFYTGLNKQIVQFETFPLEAVKYVNNNDLKGRLFAPLGWGCYTNYTAGCKVFITEKMYQPDKKTLKDYNTIINIYKGYSGVFDRYDIDWIMIPQNLSLAIALKMNDTWEPVYQDKLSIIFARQKSLKNQ